MTHRLQLISRRSFLEGLNLAVGGLTLGLFSAEALAHLRLIPTIVLDYPTALAPFEPTVRITTAVYGIHRPGTAYRMDGVPIRLRAFLPSEYPDDREVLTRIEKRLDPADVV